jgi:hypothetical protein
MPTKVVLYTLQSEASVPELEGPMGCCKRDICADLSVLLEAAGVLQVICGKLCMELHNCIL